MPQRRHLWDLLYLETLLFSLRLKAGKFFSSFVRKKEQKVTTGRSAFKAGVEEKRERLLLCLSEHARLDSCERTEREGEGEGADHLICEKGKKKKKKGLHTCVLSLFLKTFCAHSPWVK